MEHTSGAAPYSLGMRDETATGAGAPRPPGADRQDVHRGDRSDLTPFQQAVVDAVGSLHPGEVVTYGDIASQAGSPGAAQAVANVLRRVDGLPWWRVVPSDGRLYCTHAPVQAPLLRAEGVLVDDERRVDAPGAVADDAEPAGARAGSAGRGATRPRSASPRLAGR